MFSGKTIAEVLESVFERTIRLKVDEIIYTYGWDFSSSQWFTTTRDWPNWGGFVKLWGLPLKSLICLLKTFIFTCKLTLGSSYRHFIKEVISSATTVHTDQFIIWCNFSRQVTNANMVSKLYKMIWNNKSESFSRLRLYYERCSFLNQWWKTKSKSSVCSSLSIKCKQSNDTKQLEANLHGRTTQKQTHCHDAFSTVQRIMQCLMTVNVWIVS